MLRSTEHYGVEGEDALCPPFCAETLSPLSWAVEITSQHASSLFAVSVASGSAAANGCQRPMPAGANTLSPAPYTPYQQPSGDRLEKKG